MLLGRGLRAVPLLRGRAICSARRPFSTALGLHDSKSGHSNNSYNGDSKAPEFSFGGNSKYKISTDDLSPEAKKIKQQLSSKQEHPAVVLRTVLTRTDALVPLDVLLLPLRALADRLAQLAVPARKEEMRREPIAAAFLQYIWAHDTLWRKLACYAHDDMLTLCHYANAEGLDDYILDWLYIEDLPGRESIAEQHGWRSYLLRRLVQARLDNDENGSANSALEVFFEVYDQKKRARADYARLLRLRKNVQKLPISSISIFPAVIALRSALAVATISQNTEAKLYDRFMLVNDELPAIGSDIIGNMGRAMLALGHPTNANVQPALDIIEQRFLQPTPAFQDWLRMGSSTEISLRFFFRRTSTHLQLQKRDAEADRVAKIYRNLVGRDLGMRIPRR